MEQEFGWKESLLVDKLEPFDWSWKCHFQGHTEYYLRTLMIVVKKIQSAHTTIGCREIQKRFFKIWSNEDLLLIWEKISVSRWTALNTNGKNQRARSADVVTPL